MPLYSGSVLKHGLLWAGVVIAVWWISSLFANSRFYALAAVAVWTASWCLVLYFNAKRHERRNRPTVPRP
jgi:hypothetical protein